MCGDILLVKHSDSIMIIIILLWFRENWIYYTVIIKMGNESTSKRYMVGYVNSNKRFINIKKCYFVVF